MIASGRASMRVFSIAAALAVGAPFALVAQAGGIVGRLIDSSSTRPVTGSQLEVFREGVPIARTTSDSSGRFALHGLAGGAYDLSVRAIGYEPRRVAGITVAGN